MTTLSEDRDSWRASGLLRRDFRHTHDGPEVPPHRRKRTARLRKWCRGHEGREHTPVWVQTSTRMLTNICSECGKRVGWQWTGWR